MTYLFKTYQQLIQAETTNECLDKTVNEASIEVISTIDQELFEIKTKKKAVFYVQKVELAIANHLSTIAHHLNTNDSISRAKQLNICNHSLETIQSHIERTYAVYRESHKPVNNITIEHVARELTEKEKSLEIALIKNQINPKLINVILHPLRQIGEETRTGYVTQDCIDYLSHFASELEKHLDGFGNIREHQLIQHLYVLNFNNMALLTYLCEDYQKLKDNLDDESRLLDFLMLQLSQLNHLPKGEKKPYNADLTDLKLQVKYWLEQEISSLKKEVKRNEKKLKRESGRGKLKFNISVDVITCFFRLLREAEVIEVGANETVRWIHQNISSKNQVDISQQSIQRKFFEKHPNRQPIEQLVVKLQSCLDQ